MNPVAQGRHSDAAPRVEDRGPSYLARLVKTHCLKSLSAASLSFTTYCVLLAMRASYCFTVWLRTMLYKGSADAFALLSNCCTLEAAIISAMDELPQENANQMGVTAECELTS